MVGVGITKQRSQGHWAETDRSFGNLIVTWLVKHGQLQAQQAPFYLPRWLSKQVKDSEWATPEGKHTQSPWAMVKTFWYSPFCPEEMRGFKDRQVSPGGSSPDVRPIPRTHTLTPREDGLTTQGGCAVLQSLAHS